MDDMQEGWLECAAFGLVRVRDTSQLVIRFPKNSSGTGASSEDN